MRVHAVLRKAVSVWSVITDAVLMDSLVRFMMFCKFVLSFSYGFISVVSNRTVIGVIGWAKARRIAKRRIAIRGGE